MSMPENDYDKGGTLLTRVGTFAVLFMFYSLLGAIVEHLSYWGGKEKRKKVLANPIITGFPIYALGAYLIVWVSQFVRGRIPWPLEFVVYGLLLTVLEFIAGILMKAGPTSFDPATGQVGAWDYSGQPFNIKGIVDLRHFVLFGLAGLVVSRVHPYLKERVGRMFQ